MNLEILSQYLNKLEKTTDACFNAMQNSNFKSINILLEKREGNLHILADFFNKDFSINKNKLDDSSKNALSGLEKKFKKITKDSKKLADSISREKMKTLEEIKKLKNGKKVLKGLKKKIGNKRIVSKII